jgi:hypothetical protein
MRGSGIAQVSADSRTPEPAGAAAAQPDQLGQRRVRGRIYVVESIGPFEDDSNLTRERRSHARSGGAIDTLDPVDPGVARAFGAA